MISDEVLTGLGRTGRMWGIEHYDVVPDILVYGKNLSGGIAPLCGISARNEIMGDNTDFASGSTFAGMPAGCAAAIRTLQIFERDHILAHAKRLGNIAAGIMREWETYSIVRQARGNGLLLGVSFGKPESAGVDEKDWWTARAVRGKMLEERCVGDFRSPRHDSNVSRAQYGGICASRRTADHGRRYPARREARAHRRRCSSVSKRCFGLLVHIGANRAEPGSKTLTL